MSKRRPSGDGMVRKRDDGRWEGRIVVGHKDDGKPIFRSVFGKSQKELLEKLHQQKTVYQDVELTEGCAMTLGDWLDKWLDDYMNGTVRPSTLQGYRNYAENYIKPHLGEKTISLITTTDVQRMYTKLKKSGRIVEHEKSGKSLSDSTVRSVHSMLHLSMEMAKHEGFIAHNPTLGTVVPKPNPPAKQILNQKQLNLFLSVIEGDCQWHDFFYTAITTGLRRGELCGLQWEDLDLELGTLKISRTVHDDMTIGDTKTGESTRKIFLPPSAMEVLAERKETVKSEWIFPNLLNPTQPTRPSTAYRQLNFILEKANLPSIRFHDLRHTFATHALTNGVDAKTLSHILGHTKASFTLDTYTHVTGDMQQRAAQIVGGFLEGVMV
ncbi:site-specific integrase [Bengtsoniella intestinalis]|uniref:tyrosine-type recombinase/integrase n=1 Tax=Bengtsoniella intestinalis TaxID=3073143 RepID=UPI00391F44C1